MTMEFEEIKRLLPQRFPFIMIDKVLRVEPGKEAVAVKNVSGNDIVFLGHFPERAILPGALIIEAMAQTAIVLFSADRGTVTEKETSLYLLGSVKARFYQPVVPGDQLIITATSVKSLPAIAYVNALAEVEGQKISEAELVFSVKPL